MFGDEIILRGEAAYQNVKGTFPGNRGYLVGSSLAGKPYPPHGIAVVWTGISWKPEGITPLDSVDDLQTYAGVEGAVASVAGVQYTYGAGGWVAAGGLVLYADFTALSAQAPTVGKIAQIPRLCGNGYFALRGNGTRWEVCPGESIVRDAGAGSAGYDLTATGTTYVPMVSYTIPADLIGDGEEWEFTAQSGNLAVHTGTGNIQQAYIGGASVYSNLLSTNPNRGARLGADFIRTGNTMTSGFRSGTIGTSPTAPIAVSSVNLGSDQIATFGFAPGAAANTMRLICAVIKRNG